MFVPSPQTVSRDVKKVFVVTRRRLAGDLQVGVVSTIRLKRALIVPMLERSWEDQVCP